MTNRTTLILLTLCFAVAPSSLAAETSHPNRLFILTDDQGWTTPSCYGNSLVQTPYLDQLAGEGARFTDASVTATRVQAATRFLP